MSDGNGTKEIVMDIIGYAKKNNKTFTEKPFDEIDAVMLAEFILEQNGRRGQP